MASGFTGRVMVRASPSSDLVAHRSDVTRYNNLRRRNPVVDEHVRLTLVLKLSRARQVCSKRSATLPPERSLLVERRETSLLLARDRGCHGDGFRTVGSVGPRIGA